MTADRESHAWLLAEYQAAMERERAEWKVLGDTRAGAADRVAAYARWRAAAERTKTLSIRIREVRRAAQPSPTPTPHPQAR